MDPSVSIGDSTAILLRSDSTFRARTAGLSTAGAWEAARRRGQSRALEPRGFVLPRRGTCFPLAPTGDTEPVRWTASKAPSRWARTFRPGVERFGRPPHPDVNCKQN